MSLKRCTFEVIIPSLCHGSITDEPPEDINEAPEDPKAAFQNHVCRNPVLFAKNPSASSEDTFWFSKEAFLICSEASPQTHLEKCSKGWRHDLRCVP